MAVRRCGVSNVKLQGWWHQQSQSCHHGPIWHVHHELVGWICGVGFEFMILLLNLWWWSSWWCHDSNWSILLLSQRWKSYLALAWSCQFAVWCCAATLNTDFGGPSKYQLSNIGSPCKEYVVRIVCALHVVVECSCNSKVVATIRHQKLGASRKPFLANFLHAESFKDTSASSCLASLFLCFPNTRKSSNNWISRKKS